MNARPGLDTNLLWAMFGDPELSCGVSASCAGACIECPARLALPGARTKSDAADRGNELHEFARVVTVNPAVRETALAAVPEKWRHTAAGMNLDEALDGLNVIGCEQAYALDVKAQTVRYLGSNIGRDYNAKEPLRRYEIPFTIDVEAMVDGTPVELDYKSGQSIGDPSMHWQRRICATGLMLFHGTSSAISRVAYIWDSGEIKHDGCEFTILDAEDFCATMIRMIDAVWEARLELANGVMPTLSPSDSACAYCPAMMSCPWWMNTAKAMLGKLQEITDGPELSALTPAELGKVWELAKKAEKLIEPLLDGLKLVASQTPIPIGEGHEVRPAARSKTYFNDAKARGLIVQLLGKAGADDKEIERQLKALNGRTDYVEYRKLKVVA